MKERIYNCCKVLHSALVVNAPKDTWNLALNSIRLIQINNKWEIRIGGEIAPYAVFTNIKWQKGVNPNETWIEKTIENTMPFIRNIMSGAISVNEIDDYIAENHYNRLRETYKEHIRRKKEELANI